MSSDIIRHWLQYLDCAEYGDSFIYNGYDDLETVKLIQREDLEAIGVTDTDHQEYLLSAVKVLKEQGAAWVHLLSCHTAHGSGVGCVVNYEYSQSDQNSYGSSGPESNKSSDDPHSDDTYSEESNGNGKFFAYSQNQLMHNSF